MKPLLLPILISIFCFGSITVYPKGVADIKGIDFDLFKELKKEEKIDWNKIERRLYEELKATSGKGDATIHQAIGYGLLKTDSPWERATVHFKKAVALDPTLYFSWYNLGLIYMDTEKGDEYFKKSIETNSFYSPPYYWLAYSYCRSRKDKEAIPIFEKYLEVAEDEPDEVDKVRVVKKALKELHSGIEGKNLNMMRRPSREKKK